MIKKLVLLILIFFVLMPSNITASFRGYSIDEMKEKSDLIIIGKVVKSVGELKNVASFPHTVWLIKADYYIKGKIRNNYVKVATPGTKTYLSSANYDLGDIGGYTILFLCNQKNNIYQTMSITGTAALQKQLNGKYKVKKTFAVNPDELQSYIDNSKFYKPRINVYDLIFYVTFITALSGYLSVIIKNRLKLKHLS